MVESVRRAVACRQERSWQDARWSSQRDPPGDARRHHSVRREI